MTNCEKCGEKMGFFQTKYGANDENGNPITICLKCYQESKKKIKAVEKQKNPEKELRIIKKQKVEDHKIQEENMIKYSSRCNNKFENNQNVDDTINEVQPPEIPSAFNDEAKRIEQISIRKLHLNEYNRENEKILNGLKIKSEPIPNKSFIKEMSSFCFVCLKRVNENLYTSSNEEYNTINNFKVCNSCISKVENKITLLKSEIQKLDSRYSNEADEETKNFINQYLSNKDIDFKGMIMGICRNKDLFGLIEEEDLDFLQEHFVKLYQQAKEHTPNSSVDYDEIMSLETTCNNAVQLIADVTKIRKLIDKKGIKSDYIQIFEEMAKIVEQDMKKTIEKITIPAYKLISKITKDKKQIIKEYLKLGFDTPYEKIIEDLFDKFGLSYTSEEVTQLLAQCIEDADLEDFEENLGTKQKKKIGDFENLNGPQFEDYLKELFSILGYQVIRTKLSGDQGADLIIKKDEQKTVVQAKKYYGNVTNQAIQEVVASKEHYGANKAMVITTGTFTKSAIELAKSNKVELWDKNKLNEVISSVNSKSNQKILVIPQSAKKVDNHFQLCCPLCEFQLNIPLGDIPLRGKTTKIICPQCEVGMIMSPGEENYICIGCKKVFDNLKVKMEHMKRCKLTKKRQFICSFCAKYFRLDDSELDELKKNGVLKTDCPSCNKLNILKKRIK